MPISLAADRRTNSVIMQGDLKSLETAEQVLKVLDSDIASQKRMQIFPLKFITPTQLQPAIQNLDLGVSAHADERTNSYVVSARAEDMERITALIRVLDVADSPRATKPAPAKADVSLRLVWLIEEKGAPSNAAPVPPDLKEMIEALRQKIGLAQLRTVAQTIVRITPRDAGSDKSEFKSSGIAAMSAGVEYDFSGDIDGIDPRSIALKLNITARESSAKAPLFELKTVCSPTVGKPIILGTTTLASESSVFVVQILE